MIEELLRKGLGVEDIALETGQPVRMVRDVVASLRASGSLSEVLRKPAPEKQRA